MEDSKDTSTGNETETILFATRMVSVTPSHNQIIVNQVPSINSSDNSDTPTRKTFNVNRVQIPVKQNELDKDASKIKVNSAKEKNNLVKNNDTNVAVKTKLSKPEDDEETESKKFKLED